MKSGTSRDLRIQPVIYGRLYWLGGPVYAGIMVWRSRKITSHGNVWCMV